MGRSGSRTLAQLVNHYQPDSCMLEPFFEGFHDGRYRRIAMHFGLSEALKQIPTPHFKHCWHFCGWPFPENSTLNRELLAHRGYDIAFVTRRNLLKKIVSNHIANQCGVYHVLCEEERTKREGFPYEPIPLKAVAWGLENWPKELDKAKRVLKWAGKRWKAFVMEDLFAGAIPELLDFFGIEPASKPMPDLRNTDSSAPLYEKVPNIHEIEEQFGCDETGWLFKSSAPH